MEEFEVEDSSEFGVEGSSESKNSSGFSDFGDLDFFLYFSTLNFSNSELRTLLDSKLFSTLFEDFFRQLEGIHCGRDARVEGDMGENFDDFFFRQPGVESIGNVGFELR